MREIHQKIVTMIFISLVATGAMSLASRTNAFHDLNLRAYDFLITNKAEPRPSSDIIIVDFDDATLARIKQFPVPRNLVASVIVRVAEAGAKVIGLDFLLSEQRSEAQDAAMEAALVQAGNVVVANQSGSGGIPAIVPLQQFCEPDPTHYGDCRKGAFAFAFVNMPIDSDGFIRRMMLFSLDENQSESFPLKIAELFTGTPITAKPAIASFGSHSVPYADQAKTVLIGSWATEPAPSVSAMSVLDGKVAASYLRDKIVLLGQSNDAAKDRELTPLFRQSQTSGARLRLSGTQIHAAAIATLLEGTAIGPIADNIVLVLSFILTCIAVWIVLQVNPRYSIPAVGLLIICCYFAAQWVFNIHHRWFQYVVPQACVATAVPLTLAYQFVRERLHRSEAVAQRTQMMGLFSRYVTAEVANEIWNRREEIVLAGEERIATVLFSDIRGFTSMTAGKPSQEVLAWLNNYFTAMDEVITAEGGFLNKFIGDGLMVLFGVPVDHGVQEDAIRGVRTAIRMVQKVEELNRSRLHDSIFPAFRIGVGIHTGSLTSGNIGSRNRLEYSAIGDSVNLASRCESLNKDFHTEIILTEATYRQVAGRFPDLQQLGPVRVRGFQKDIQLYTVQTAGLATESAVPAPGAVHENQSL